MLCGKNAKACSYVRPWRLPHYRAKSAKLYRRLSGEQAECVLLRFSENDKEGKMSMNAVAEEKTTKRGGVLDFIERVGNALPHPWVLFLWLCLILAVVSAVLSYAGVSVINPTKGEEVVVRNLISTDGFVWLLTNLLKNFQTFTPLGLVLAMQMAIGFSERTGMLNTAMRKAILGVPVWALSATVFFIGINGSIASEASIVVVPSLAAAAFQVVGMHPIAGLLAGYAATNAGFTAALIPTGTDVLLSGVSETAAQLLAADYHVNATCNWYFMIAATVTLTAVGVFVNKAFIAPRLGTYQGENEGRESDITEKELRGLKASGIFTLLYIAFFAAITLPANSFMRGEDGSILNGTLITGLVPILILYFIFVGIIYGKTAGTLTSADQIPQFMAESLTSLTGYIVLVFVIAQFIDMFSYTNLGMIIAVKSSDLLKAVGFTGIPMILFFIILCSVVNLFMTSGSAKWYIFAPILVPMMMNLGYSPAFAQVIYRIGDTCTNAITPIYPYIPIALGMAKKYDKNFGMGSLIAYMLPYAVGFVAVFVVQTIVWIALNLPLGPGVSVMM